MNDDLKTKYKMIRKSFQNETEKYYFYLSIKIIFYHYENILYYFVNGFKH